MNRRAVIMEALSGYGSLALASVGFGLCASGIPVGAILLGIGSACYVAWLLSLEW